VYEEGRAFRGDLIVVWLASGTGDVAAVAGRQVGGAVVRNRARRIIRAAWRDLAPRLGQPHDAVIVARARITAARTQDVLTEMGDMLAPEADRR
jgi:ribonuclease P protein component